MQQERFSRLTPEALHLQPLIAFESSSGTRALIDGWFCGMWVSDCAGDARLAALRPLNGWIRAGLGYSIVPRMAVEHAADREGLNVVSPNDPAAAAAGCCDASG